jgi:hypothetical protein
VRELGGVEDRALVEETAISKMNYLIHGIWVAGYSPASSR